MFRLFFMVIAVVLATGLGAAHAAEAQPDAPPLPDLFTVSNVRIDATAGSAILARDAAMAQGRLDAWMRLYRRLTAQSQWGKQPQLADNQVIRLVRSFSVANERRSTTRYLADVTYQFNAAAVRLTLRQANVSYTDTRSKPALVIPAIDGKGFDANGAWAMTFNDPSYAEGIVPLIAIKGDGDERAIAARDDLAELDWATLEPLAAKYGAGEVVVAIATEDANTVQVIEVTPMARMAAAFAFAQSTFKADADAIADKISEEWKGRTSVDFGTRNRLTADVQFDSLAQWSRIRAQLRSVRAISDVDVVGISANEAEIGVSYFGRLEQLRDALAQQNLVLAGPPAAYSIQAGRASAANTP